MHIRKSLAAVGIVTGSVLASTLAFAAWTADGTGSGSAKAISAKAVVASGADAAAQLYPGGKGDLHVTIKNDNPYPVRAIQINGNGTIFSGNAACDASHGVSFANQTGTWDVAKNSSATFVLTDAVSMSNASVDACQGLGFTVPVAVVAASNAS